MKKKISVVLLCAVFLGACSPSPQETAYYEAQKAEQDAVMVAGALAPLTIQKYQEVIRMDPKSRWAEKSQKRIDVLQKAMQDYQRSLMSR
jgi:outer membrane protein assembly factor BamD (BamD/ComL family)